VGQYASGLLATAFAPAINALDGRERELRCVGMSTRKNVAPIRDEMRYEISEKQDECGKVRESRSTRPSRGIGEGGANQTANKQHVQNKNL